jgi:hypothetical protein
VMANPDIARLEGIARAGRVQIAVLKFLNR